MVLFDPEPEVDCESLDDLFEPKKPPMVEPREEMTSVALSDRRLDFLVESEWLGELESSSSGSLNT